MNVTNYILKLKNELEILPEGDNDTLKYSLIYNSCEVDVFFSKAALDYISIVMNVSNVKYLTSLYIFEKNNNYYLNYYLPTEIYEIKNIKFKLLLKDGVCKTTPFFDSIMSAILNKKPVKTSNNELMEITKHNTYKYKKRVDLPYFSTIVRKKMSSEMKSKIIKKYPDELAQKILKFCGENKTLQFTDDIKKAKRIEIFL